jgi:ankyrin repeat protein
MVEPLLTILALWPSALLTHCPDGIVASHFGVAQQKYRSHARTNTAANHALAEACYLEVPNNKPERYEDVKRSLESGARPNIHDEYAYTPLMHEAEWGHRRTVMLLLQYSASASRSDSEGNTALIYACSRPFPDTEIVMALLRHGASVTHRNKYGRHAFYYARRSLRDSKRNLRGRRDPDVGKWQRIVSL